jgi:hypothetical protein
MAIDGFQPATVLKSTFVIATFCQFVPSYFA